MKKTYRVHLGNKNDECLAEIRPTEGTEVVHVNLDINVHIKAASIADAENAALAYAIKEAPDIQWEVTCAELLDRGAPVCRGY